MTWPASHFQTGAATQEFWGDTCSPRLRGTRRGHVSASVRLRPPAVPSRTAASPRGTAASPTPPGCAACFRPGPPAARRPALRLLSVPVGAGSISRECPSRDLWGPSVGSTGVRSLHKTFFQIVLLTPGPPLRGPGTGRPLATASCGLGSFRGPAQAVTATLTSWMLPGPGFSRFFLVPAPSVLWPLARDRGELVTCWWQSAVLASTGGPT